MFRVYPYKMGSKSGKALSQGLGCKMVYPNRKYKPKPDHLVVNWGNSTIPDWYVGTYSLLNNMEFVDYAKNKLTSLFLMKDGGVSIPEFTTDIQEVKKWDCLAVARKTLTGKGGEGIIIFNTYEEIPKASLYTRYVKKTAEYRVHVFNGKIIDFSKKKAKKGADIDYRVRSYANGWVFCREGVVLPELVGYEAVQAVTAIGLDFGAVDVVWNQHYQKAYVLEVNTAPGLEGQTLVSYVNAIKGFIND